MSRAALWRQEGNVKEREQRAEEVFLKAVEDGQLRARSKGVLPLWGAPDSFHFNPLLLRNTVRSLYFQKCCEKLLDWNAVVDEIYYEVKYLQPFALDKSPSTAFCLLLRLLTLRVTNHQMELTLKHTDSPYIRGIGFLYLRYAGPPEQIWSFIESSLQDEEELVIEAGHRGKRSTIGQFVRSLFSSRDFYGTSLPRLPIQTERDIQVKILQAEKIAERAFHHFKNQQRMRVFQTLGAEIMALYGDEDNPVTWYRAMVDRVIFRDEASGQTLKYPKFVVTFPEYGNTETVSLGEIDALDGQWKDEKSSSVGRRDSPDVRGLHGGDEGELYEEVRRREKETVTAEKGWARRPSTTKRLLAQQLHRGHSIQDEATVRRKSAVPLLATSSQQELNVLASPKKRSADELAAIAEKKRNLMAKYG
jgi:pre-mRNA-splicing factor 38B